MSEDFLEVYAIYHAIQELPRKARQRLWELLEHAFPRVLDDTDPAPAEVWDDPRNGFGTNGAKLLRFLCDWGVARERDVLKHLWRAEWRADLAVENLLRQRLRKLEGRTRHKLKILKSDWVLNRPRPHQLELIRPWSWDPD